MNIHAKIRPFSGEAQETQIERLSTAPGILYAFAVVPGFGHVAVRWTTAYGWEGWLVVQDLKRMPAFNPREVRVDPDEDRVDIEVLPNPAGEGRILVQFYELKAAIRELLQ